MTKIIAELGINHNGILALAERMIVSAANAGCDGIKVQSYRTGDFLPAGHPDWDMFERAEIWPHLARLCEFTHGYGMIFGITPTSLDGIQEAVEAGCDFLKNGSDYLLRTDMIRRMVWTGLPTWVSTGMATSGEVWRVPEEANLMVCTSTYPCRDHDANLLRLRQLGIYRIVGFSDHTTGITASIVAVSLGAEMIEKHFTVDRDLPGPDHKFSATPAEMEALVTEVRRVEVLLGNPEIRPVESEFPLRDMIRVTKDKKRACVSSLS